MAVSFVTRPEYNYVYICVNNFICIFGNSGISGRKKTAVAAVGRVRSVRRRCSGAVMRAHIAGRRRFGEQDVVFVECKGDCVSRGIHAAGK